MFRLLIAFTLVAGAAAAAPPSLDPTGLWRTNTDHGQVEIVRCGDSICGRLAWSDVLGEEPDATDDRNQDPSQRGRPLKGLLLLHGYSGGPAEWTGGVAYDPSSGRAYRSKLRLVDEDTLQVFGCIGPLCRAQTWTRMR